MNYVMIKSHDTHCIRVFAEHLSKVKGMKLNLMYKHKEWHLKASHSALQGSLSLNPDGVWMSSERVRGIHTMTGITFVPYWARLLTFDGKVIDKSILEAD